VEEGTSAEKRERLSREKTPSLKIFEGRLSTSGEKTPCPGRFLWKGGLGAGGVAKRGDTLV